MLQRTTRCQSTAKPQAPQALAPTAIHLSTMPGRRAAILATLSARRGVGSRRRAPPTNHDDHARKSRTWHGNRRLARRPTRRKARPRTRSPPQLRGRGGGGQPEAGRPQRRLVLAAGSPQSRRASCRQTSICVGWGVKCSPLCRLVGGGEDVVGGGREGNRTDTAEDRDSMAGQSHCTSQVGGVYSDHIRRSI
eukprot:COSAG01_NODE_28291_length_664_cov_3.334513_1_plen_192_part_01